MSEHRLKRQIAVAINFKRTPRNSAQLGVPTYDSQLGVGIFDAPEVFSDTLVHSGVGKSQTGKLQFPFPILGNTNNQCKFQ